MPYDYRRPCCLAAALLAAWSISAPALSADAPVAAEGAAAAVDFNREIRPILSNNCFKCHGPDAAERKSGLRLDVAAAATGPADSGAPAIVPGKPDESELIRRVFSTDPAEQMPPPESGKSLTDRERDLLRHWITEGAEYRMHWSFVRPVRPHLPEVANRSWRRNSIDYFILERLERAGLSPAAPADAESLARRVTLDLTGLPPSMAELDAYLADARPDAYERLVERLLASPYYGERMAVDWLDAARFADTHGYHLDSGRDMSRWREWVIAAFNRNLPFDQFTIEQLAGDLLPGATLEQQIASGFNRNHMLNFEGGAIPEEYHTAYIVDRINTTGTVWLGLTVGCGQCHDHKYDPITQQDYYRLYAFFHNVPEKGLDGMNGNAAPLIKLPSAIEQQRMAELQARITDLQAQLAAPNDDVDAAQAAWETTADPSDSTIPEGIRSILAVASEARTAEQRDALRRYFRESISQALSPLHQELVGLQKDLADFEAQIPTSMVMQELDTPRETFVLVRGQYDKHGERVTAGVPASLPPLADGAPNNRLGLAQWLVDPGHPLTARVIVNRYWQATFGVGLVKTSEDFGLQGEPPSHPELLDWLATELVGSGWDMKHIHRLLVTSAAYRQSAAVLPATLAADPENRLLARGPRLRLQAEFIRDLALAASGLLNRRIGGPSVSPYQPAGLWEELSSREDSKKWTAQFFEQSHGPDLYRRTMYTFWKRTSPPPTLLTFDAPDRESCIVRRPITNTPLQALVLWNDPTYVEAARKLAERVLREADATPEARIVLAMRLVTSRQPTAGQLAVVRGLYEEQLARFQADSQAALDLLSVGESPRDPALDPAELAAWCMVASTVLNLDAAMTR